MMEGVFNLVIVGEAGQGLVTIGRILTKALIRSGYTVVVTQSYMSRIRGGHNTFAIRISPEEILAPHEEIDLLVAMKIGFVARSFSGMEDHLSSMIKQAIAHRRFSLVDILQPCVSFNKINTYKWYKQRCYELPEDYDPTDRDSAMKKAVEFGEKIPVGIIYRNDRPAFESKFTLLDDGPLVGREVDKVELQKVIDGYK